MTRKGFSLIELVLVVGAIAVIAAIVFPDLRGRRSVTELDLTTRAIGAVLREAQQNALLGASSSAWGVHFDNTDESPFYALYAGTYTASSTDTRALLPKRLRFRATSVPPGESLDVLFSAGTGRAAQSYAIGIELNETAGSVTSTTITVSQSGNIQY